MTTEFFAAIKDGNKDEVQRLFSLDQSLIHSKENGISPVLVAAYHNKPEIAHFLADRNFALNIFEAAATGRTTSVIHLLAHDPTLANAYAPDGFQPLGLACFFGHKDTAGYLIKAGAQINSPSQNLLRAAPLQSATAAGYLKIVMLLLDHGADPNIREQAGNTPLHAAAQNGNTEIIRTLLFNGADLNIKNKAGKTPLELALEAKKLEATELLKEGITRRFRVKRLNSSNQ